MSTVCARLAGNAGDAIVCNSRLESIFVENERVTGVRVNGENREVSAVISTAPVHILAKMISGSDALRGLAAFRYRPMILVNLRLEGRGLLPNVVTWTPERDLPFFRLTEAPLAIPSMAPAGKTTITADIGAEIGDEHWTMSDDELGRLCVTSLERFVPDAARRFIDVRVLRTPFSYPVFLNDYEEERRRLEAGLPIDGLYSIGRNGEFLHILMEDVYCRTVAHVTRVADAWLGAPLAARESEISNAA
jgi:protoporphyrinogen oxidase